MRKLVLSVSSLRAFSDRVGEAVWMCVELRDGCGFGGEDGETESVAGDEARGEERSADSQRTIPGFSPVTLVHLRGYSTQ